MRWLRRSGEAARHQHRERARCGRGLGPPAEVRPKPVAGRQEAGAVQAVPCPVQQHPGLRPARRRLHQADAEPVDRCRDHPGRCHHQRAARVHPGGQGGKGAGFDPQHAVGGGPDRARRRGAHDSGGGARAGRRRAARIGRQGAGGPAPHRREEPADRRGGADGRVGADRQDRRPVSANATVGDRESMAFSGTMVVSGRATGVVVATGQRNGAGPHQSAARQRQRARDAAPAPDQEVRQCHHHRHRGGERLGLRLRQVGEGHGLRGDLSGGRRHRGVGHSGRLAGAHHDHAGDRRAAHGPAQRHHPASPGGGNPRLGVAHLFRQDRHADADGDDGGVRSDRRMRRIRSPAKAMRPRARSRRTASRLAKTPVLELLGRVSMLCNDAELFQQEGVWKVEGDPTEGALYPFATKLGMDRQAEQAAYPRIDAIPFESEHNFMATLHKARTARRFCWSRERRR